MGDKVKKYSILFFSSIILFLISLLPILIFGEDSSNLPSKEIKENLTKYEINKLQSGLATIKSNEKVNIIIKVKKDKEVIQTKIKNGKIKQVKSSNLIVGEIYGSEIEKLAKEEDVELIEIDQELELLDENIPYGVAFTGAPDVWEDSKGDGINIAVLDTGIFAHDDLNIAGGISFVSEDYNDTNGHGTAVAGVIGALINDEGLIGVSPDVNLYAVKIMNSSLGQLSDAIDGVDWAIENNMNIISMSFGYSAYSQIFKEKLQEAYDNNILLIGAAGNNGGDVVYPAKYNTVIAVGATDEQNNTASFSAHGNELELIAPGVDINTTTKDNTYDLFGGTSFSAPHVAGVAALIWSYNQSLTNEELRAKLANDAIDLGEKGKDDYYGYGLVHVDLNKWDVQPFNQSYNYWIYNVSDYGKENQTEMFWLEGYGTIDDVDFSVGYYHTFRNFGVDNVSEYIYVHENGTIETLTFEIQIDDNWAVDGGVDGDFKTWVNYYNQVKYYDDLDTPNVECFTWDNSPTTYDECFANTNGNMNTCKSASSELNNICNGGADCSGSDNIYTDAIGDWHSTDTSVIMNTQIRLKAWFNCGGTLSTKSKTDWYNVFDRRRVTCTGGGDKYYEGRYATPNSYTFYKQTSCNATATCDSALGGIINSSDTGDLKDICRQKDGNNCGFDSDCITGHYCNQGICGAEKIYYCDGTVEVNTLKSDGSAYNGLYVRLDGTEKGTTGETGQQDGQYLIILNNLVCGTQYEVAVNCSTNQSKVCGTDLQRINFDDDDDYMTFTCDICDESISDMYIGLSDISISSISGSNDYNISVTVHTTNVAGTDVKVSFQPINEETGLIKETESKNDTITFSKATTEINAYVSMNLADVNFIYIYLDPDNKVVENKDNNFVVVPFIKEKPMVHLDISVYPPILNSLIEDYLELFVNNTDENSADFIIAVGNPSENNLVASLNKKTEDKHSWWYGDGSVYYNDKSLGNKPYNGLVGVFTDDSGKQYLFIYGNGIEGTIAGVKRLINVRNILFNVPKSEDKDKVDIIGDYDILGISVYDLMHINESNSYYNTNTDEFRDVVERILNDNNFEQSIKTVKTVDNTSYGENTTLRIRHINTDFSEDFKEATNNTKPVVLSHGMHSNLDTWKDFGEDIADAGRDTWLIEMYGGPTTEDCEYGCPNYTFADLKNNFWPALMAGVEYYSGQNKVSYVGYDLGCTVALESLENYQNGANNISQYFDYDIGKYVLTDLSANVVDTFVGVGCIGNFTQVGSSYISGEKHLPSYIDLFNVTHKYFNDTIYIPQNINHLSPTFIRYNYLKEDIGKSLLPIAGGTGFLGAGIIALVASQQYHLIPFLVEAYGAEILTSITIPIVNAALFTGYPINGAPISRNILDDIYSWVNDPNELNPGENVQFNNFAIIQSNKIKPDLKAWSPIPFSPIVNLIQIDDAGTDGFVSVLDQKQICKNVNSNNKYYIGFENIPHFSIVEKGIADRTSVKKVINDFLDDDNIVKKYNEYTIISNQQNCE